MNSKRTLKNVYISRNFTLTVASCISVIIMPGDCDISASTVFILRRLHCSLLSELAVPQS